ncbi:MAG: ATP synthase F0 subunit B [Erysipelotrichia bacterium]|nr:ATP synthase F0 subunit B [Erysipelotrichia bacterium]
MTIYEKIAKKGQAESDAIRKEAEIEAKGIEHKIVAEAEKEASLIISASEDARRNAIHQNKALNELEIKQVTSSLKSKVIDDIFASVFEHFNNIKEKELLSFVVHLIRNEKIDGGEVMRVNKNNYAKYLNALSSHKAAKKIDLDLLNKALGDNYHLVLENVDSREEDGFILIGETYDLNFSVKPLLNVLRKKREKELYKMLFGDEE